MYACYQGDFPFQVSMQVYVIASEAVFAIALLLLRQLVGKGNQLAAWSIAVGG